MLSESGSKVNAFQNKVNMDHPQSIQIRSIASFQTILSSWPTLATRPWWVSNNTVYLGYCIYQSYGNISITTYHKRTPTENGNIIVYVISCRCLCGNQRFVSEIKKTTLQKHMLQKHVAIYDKIYVLQMYQCRQPNKNPRRAKLTSKEIDAFAWQIGR